MTSSGTSGRSGIAGRGAAALGLLALLALVGGCATSAPVNPRDPFEATNRAVFEFNDGVDKAFVKPVAQAYRAVLPQPVRSGVRNFFANLQDPWIGVNNLLQGKVEEGLTDWFRFATNSTIGLGGVIDVATGMRMSKHNEDFGQTLGVWGFSSGPYLVLPLLGPSDVRDGLGLIPDAYGYGGFWLPRLIDPPHRVAWRNSLSALDIVSLRASLLDTEGIFEAAALDRYTFLRDAYLQRRRNLIYDGNPPPEPRREEDSKIVPRAVPRADLETDPSRWILAFRPAPHAPGGADAVRVFTPTVPANYERVLAAGNPAVGPRGEEDK
jgi:phospholipid-binding lipoprotein MlaA